MENIQSKLCNKPIVIDDWRQDDTYEGIYPKGARDKSAYFSPESIDKNCLKSSFRYLFKLSRSWCPWQFWGEIIAYRLGLIMGVEVPPSHIGMSNNYNPGKTTYGALIEWFYNDKKDLYVEGGQIMIGIIKGYDRQKGAQHNFLSISHYFKKNFIKNFSEHWAGVFTLDCLTGNTDRHQDNWGLIFKGIKGKKPKDPFVLFSPAFDNGTALSYEILEENIDKYKDEKRLEKYLTNPQHARHHMKWSLEEDEEISFFEFMKKFALEFDGSKDIIIKLLGFNRQQVEDVMNPLIDAVSDDKYGLSRKRLQFIIKLIFERKELLEQALDI